LKILTNIEYLGNDIYDDIRTYKISYIDIEHLSPEVIARAMGFEKHIYAYGNNVMEVLNKHGIDLIFHSRLNSIGDLGR
jgi:cAMP phosphodiesterase